MQKNLKHFLTKKESENMLYMILSLLSIVCTSCYSESKKTLVIDSENNQEKRIIKPKNHDKLEIISNLKKNGKKYKIEKNEHIKKIDTKLFDALCRDYPGLLTGKIQILTIEYDEQNFFLRMALLPRGPGSVFAVLYDKNYQKIYLIPGM